MRYLSTKIILLAILTLVMSGCSSVKKVPEGEHLLTKNQFNFSGDEKPFKSVIPAYVKQKPNAHALFGLLPLKLMFYNSVGSKFDTVFTEFQDLSRKRRNQHSMDSLLVKNNLEEYKGRSFWLKRFFYNQGEPPVLIDMDMASFSEENLEKFYFDRGYFDSKIDVSAKFDSTRKKGKLVYEIDPGEFSVINSYNFEIKDTTIKRFYERRLLRNSKIKEGSRYDMNDFIEEKDRIVEFLRNRGYYKFNEDAEAIEFTADTTYTTKSLDITLLIPKENDSINPGKIFSRYRYRDIYIYPDSAPVPAGQPQPEYYDTIYDGYHFRYTDPKKKYRPKFFSDALVFKSGDLFRTYTENQTKRNLSRREGVDRGKYNIIDFGDTVDPEMLINGDRPLDVEIYFTPKKKYDMFYGADLSWSEFMNFGVSPSISLLTRNLFGGGENLESTIRGTLGNVNRKFTDESYFFNAYELAFQAKMRFPYLLAPFKTDSILPKQYFKQTDLRLGAQIQRNIGLGRMSYSTGLDYSVSFRDTHSHLLTLANIEFVNNLQKDNYFSVFQGDNRIKNDFFNQYYFMYNPGAGIDYFHGNIGDTEMINQIFNDMPFLLSLDQEGLSALALFENMDFRRRTITQDVLIASMIYQFTYNQSERVQRVTNPWFFRGMVEVAGNVPNLLDKAFGFEKTQTGPDKEAGTIFKVPYSQFVKLDLDVRKYFIFSPNSSLATRAFFGIIVPYGNTDFIPFVRSYAAGGANDIRAWSAATLGPSDLPRYPGGSQVFAIDAMKLLFSAEYRFNIMGRFNSALFVDAGNIWGIDKSEELSLFKFNKFYKELGIGAGVGLRFDLTYFLLRLDFAYKIHDPSYPTGERWRFNDLNLLKPQLAFGINYPF